jgi:hypothetical protein
MSTMHQGDRQSAQESKHRIYVEPRNEQLTGTHRDAQRVSVNNKQGYTRRIEEAERNRESRGEVIETR